MAYTRIAEIFAIPKITLATQDAFLKKLLHKFLNTFSMALINRTSKIFLPFSFKIEPFI